MCSWARRQIVRSSTSRFGAISDTLPSIGIRRRRQSRNGQFRNGQFRERREDSRPGCCQRYHRQALDPQLLFGLPAGAKDTIDRIPQDRNSKAHDDAHRGGDGQNQRGNRFALLRRRDGRTDHPRIGDRERLLLHRFHVALQKTVVERVIDLGGTLEFCQSEPVAVGRLPLDTRLASARSRFSSRSLRSGSRSGSSRRSASARRRCYGAVLPSDRERWSRPHGPSHNRAEMFASRADRSRYWLRSRVMTSFFRMSATAASPTSILRTCSIRSRRALASPVAPRAVASWLFSSNSCCSPIRRPEAPALAAPFAPPKSTILFFSLNSRHGRSGCLPSPSVHDPVLQPGACAAYRLVLGVQLIVDIGFGDRIGDFRREHGIARCVRDVQGISSFTREMLRRLRNSSMRPLFPVRLRLASKPGRENRLEIPGPDLNEMGVIG